MSRQNYKLVTEVNCSFGAEIPGHDCMTLINMMPDPIVLQSINICKTRVLHMIIPRSIIHQPKQ